MSLDRANFIFLRTTLKIEIVVTARNGFQALIQAAVGRTEASQPADSHERGTENSDQPQSRQIRTSGDGVSGGWLNVRGPLR